MRGSNTFQRIGGTSFAASGLAEILGRRSAGR
jgi:hypothetical protein